MSRFFMVLHEVTKYGTTCTIGIVMYMIYSLGGPFLPFQASGEHPRMCARLQSLSDIDSCPCAPAVRIGLRDVVRTLSRFCVHARGPTYQVNISKFLAVMTLRLDGVCTRYVLRSVAHKAAC